jgi:PAS domain S-box-containing protein
LEHLCLQKGKALEPVLAEGKNNILNQDPVLTDGFDETIRRWSELTASAQVGIAFLDEDSRLVGTNAAFQGLTAYRRAELGGMSLEDLCVDDDQPAYDLLIRSLRERTRGHAELETSLRRKDDSTVPVTLILSPLRLPAESQPLILALAIEVGAKREAEHALRAEQAELGRMARLTTASEMTASIAHELRQPLAAIVTNGNAGLRWLAHAEPNLTEVRAALQRVIDDGHRASEIISSIRAMFGKEQGKKTAVQVGELVRDVLSTLLDDLKRAQVSLIVEPLGSLQSVNANRTQLQQVLLNLVTNAIDAMKTVDDRPRVLRIRSESVEQELVLIGVQDSGTGISTGHMEQIFEPFFTTKTDGMGLGLSICRSIIEAHGGWLTASAAVPHGSIFQVALPAMTGLPK